jgi:hypothetical protein
MHQAKEGKRGKRIVPHMKNMRNSQKVLIKKPERKIPLGRPRRNLVDNIKMDLKEVGSEDVVWILLPFDRVQWQAPLIIVTSLMLSSHTGNCSS